MGTIWLVRHAPVTVRGICYGQRDVPTIRTAIEAATIISAAWDLAGAPLCDELWSSPWQRTRSVAHALASRWGVPCRVDERLSELAFGDWEGRQFTEIENTDPARLSRWMANYETEAPPGGETLAQLEQRVRAWLRERRDEGRTVLGITHAGVIRSVRAAAARVGYAAIASTPVEHLVPEKVR